jgi:hypothetical protein
MFSSRTLSYLIEEGYRCLMELEDVDALLASLAPTPHEDPARAYDRQRLLAQRADLCQRLLESLDVDELAQRVRDVQTGEHLLFKFYASAKGRLLLYRALVLLHPPQTFQLVDVLMHDLAQVALPQTSAGSTDEKLAHLVSDIVYAMPLLPYGNEIFSYLLAPKHAPILLQLLRTHLVCQLLQVILKKGHEATSLLQQNPHVPPMPGGMPGLRETVAHWRAIFDALAEAVKGNIKNLFEGLPRDAKPALPTATPGQLQARGRRQPAAADRKPAVAKEASESKEKAEESKDAKPAAPALSYALSTRFGMWELMAALFSHANEAQHSWLDVELRAMLTEELRTLYGDYAERKEKQREAAAAAAAEREKAEAAAQAEKEKKAAGGGDADKDAAAAAEKKDAESADAAAAAAASSGRPENRRAPNGVPPASSLPPPPSPALRFLASALLGEQSPEHVSINRTWSELHGDYSYYQMKHQQKVAQEQARLAQAAAMRQTRQAQQQQQWQQYQQQRRQGPPGASPQRGVPPQHAHFHHQSAPHMRGPLQFTHKPLSEQHQHHPSNQQQQQGQQHRGPRGGHHQYQQQQQSPPPVASPQKPVPVWVKPGTTGAAVAKTPQKPAAAAGPNASPAK